MATEKKWAKVGPSTFTANGTSKGVIQVATTRGYKVKMQVVVSSTAALPNLSLEIKRINSDIEMEVGPPGKIDARQDLSLYVLGTSFLYANEQNRPAIPPDQIQRAVFDEEPAMAIRNLLVDQHGKTYDTDHPVPVRLSDGSVNIGTVNAEIEVSLDHRDNAERPGDLHDSVRLGDGTNEATITPVNSRKALDIHQADTSFIVSGLTPVGQTPSLNPVSMAGIDPAGLKRHFRTSESGNTALDGEYNASTNSNPSSVGILAQVRNAASSIVRQLMRATAIRGTGSDADTVSLDMSLHDHAGQRYQVTNPLHVRIGDGTQPVDTIQHDADGNSSTLWGMLVAARNRVFNGTTWDRTRSASIGNNVAAMGLPTAVPYSQYRVARLAMTDQQYAAELLNKYGQKVGIDEICYHAEEGRAFLATTDFTNVPTTALTPFLIVRNPVGSGKTIKIYNIRVGVDTGKTGVSRVWINPTIATTPTSLTPVNLSTGGAASVMQAYRLPTVSANGTNLNTMVLPANAFSQSLDLEGYYIITPGNSIMLSVTSGANNTSTHAEFYWLEV